MRPSTSSFVVIRPRICAELCMSDAVAFSQYEQGGYLGSPILSSAVFSTRDHRGADLALPRPAVNSTVPLTRHGRTDVLVLSRVLRRVKACTEPRHYGRKAGHGGTRATNERGLATGGRGYGGESRPLGHLRFGGVCAVASRRGQKARHVLQGQMAICPRLAHAPVALLMRVG